MDNSPGRRFAASGCAGGTRMKSPAAAFNVAIGVGVEPALGALEFCGQFADRCYPAGFAFSGVRAAVVAVEHGHLVSDLQLRACAGGEETSL